MVERPLQNLEANRVAKCIEIYDVPRLRTYSDVQLSIGEAVRFHPSARTLRESDCG